MNRVIVLGSINVDLVVSVPRLPAPGETVIGNRFERHYGGKGANQAVAAARAGASVSMIGAVGSDEDGDASLAALAAEGIDCSGVHRVDGPTGIALIAVAADGENQIVVAPGANASVAAWEADLAQLSAGDLLLASLEVPLAAVIGAAMAAAARGAQIVVNPAPARQLPAALLGLHPILTPNQQELLTLTGAATQEEALDTLTRAGVEAVIVTLGPAGALLAVGALRLSIPAMPVLALDATGAGDTFSGVLAAWLAGGGSIEDAAEAANTAAGLSVTRVGAREGMPSLADIRRAANR